MTSEILCTASLYLTLINQQAEGADSMYAPEKGLKEKCLPLQAPRPPPSRSRAWVFPATPWGAAPVCQVPEDQALVSEGNPDLVPVSLISWFPSSFMSSDEIPTSMQTGRPKQNRGPCKRCLVPRQRKLPTPRPRLCCCSFLSKLQGQIKSTNDESYSREMAPPPTPWFVWLHLALPAS